MRRAVVSGLGPNGMLATLELLRAGFDVTAVEQRTSYARSIHLSLRRSWFDDVRALDPSLCDKLEAIASPIARIEHIDARGQRVVVTPAPGAGSSPTAREGRSKTGREADAGVPPTPGEVRARLSQTPVAHVRLDELETTFYGHLQQLASSSRLHLVRGVQLTVAPVAQGRFTTNCSDAPELIVIAEGGKSPTAQALGKRSQKLSAPKLYISVHVDEVIGPCTRRLDTGVEVPRGGHVRVSFWATGHGDPGKGTWLVLEVPALLHAGKGSHTFDREYFEKNAALLLNAKAIPSAQGLQGTFKFEQQLLSSPTDGANLVFFGDAAGMGHHALGTGLELGACDLRPLRALVAGGSLDDYAAAMVQSRVALLAYGMREYYPDIDVDPTPWLTEALAAAAADPEIEPRDMVESWVRSRT